MSFPRYPCYSIMDSDGLIETPEHWRTSSVKHVAEIDNSGSYGADEDEGNNCCPVATTAQICPDGHFSTEDMPIRAFKDTELTRYGCRTGDILIVKSSGSAQNIISGKAGLVEEQTPFFVFSNFLMRIRPNTDSILPKYLFYVLTSSLTRERVKRMCSSTTYPNLRVGEYVSALIPMPPLVEQQAISIFLQTEIAKIDSLMAEQEKLIALLKEKRQAVISQAVTKGLDPALPMKESGVEWLGEVPTHWGQPQKLLNVASKEQHSFVNGPFGSDLLTSELVSEGVPVVYIRDIKEQGYSRVSEWCVTSEKSQQLKFCDVIPGDIIIAKVGNPPGLAAVYPLGEPDAIVTQDVIRLRVDPKESHPEYIKWLLNSDYGRTLIDDISVESTRTRVGLGEYKQLRFFLPPVPEQKVAADFLERETAALYSLVNEAILVINLLKERRTALISAAVTGQIDVRGLVKDEQEKAA